MNEILQYFPELTDNQREQLAQLDALYRDWNAKINVISRKDIDNLYQHHVLHSMAIARFIKFKPGTTVLDLGAGGGFPGIPLAIMFPEVGSALSMEPARRCAWLRRWQRPLDLRTWNVFTKEARTNVASSTLWSRVPSCPFLIW